MNGLMLSFILTASLSAFAAGDRVAKPDASEDASPVNSTKSLIRLDQCRSDLNSFTEGKYFLDQLSDWELLYNSLQGDAKESGCNSEAYFEKSSKFQHDGDRIQTRIDVITTAKSFSTTDKRSFSSECKDQAKKAEGEVVQLKIKAGTFCKQK